MSRHFSGRKMLMLLQKLSVLALSQTLGGVKHEKQKKQSLCYIELAKPDQRRSVVDEFLVSLSSLFQFFSFWYE